MISQGNNHKCTVIQTNKYLRNKKSYSKMSVQPEIKEKLMHAV